MAGSNNNSSKADHNSMAPGHWFLKTGLLYEYNNSIFLSMVQHFFQRRETAYKKKHGMDALQGSKIIPYEFTFSRIHAHVFEALHAYY